MFDVPELFPSGRIPPYFLLFIQPQKVSQGDFTKSSQRYYTPGGKKYNRKRYVDFFTGIKKLERHLLLLYGLEKKGRETVHSGQNDHF